MFTVDIDTGGTMTDGLVSDGSQVTAIKVDTTPHDVTVSFRQVLVEAAQRLGYGTLGGFLADVGLIRWTSTITSNVLGEGKGTRLGVLVRAGHTEDLYGDGPSPAIGRLVAERNVVGLSDDAGELEVLSAVRRLFEDGARRICVVLDAFGDSTREQHVKKAVESRYPDHYLGAVPVLLGSEMAQVDDDVTRAHCAIINAYVHTRLADSLFRAEDLLRYDEGWERALLVGHINGGVARVGKTGRSTRSTRGRCSAHTPRPGTPGGRVTTRWCASTSAARPPRRAWSSMANPSTPATVTSSASRCAPRWRCCARWCSAGAASHGSPTGR